MPVKLPTRRYLALRGIKGGKGWVSNIGGRGGIRTHGEQEAHIGFQDQRTRPLCDPSLACIIASKELEWRKSRADMENRLKFLPGRQRNFLLNVEVRSGLKPDELASMVGVVPRSYRDWRREKLNMSEKAGDILCQRYGVELPESKTKMIERWKANRSEIGARGGREYFRKYGSPATLEGRRKGGAKTLAILRERGIIPLTREFEFPVGESEPLAEFVGILLGDGGITAGQAVITLNSEADREYLVFVIGLIKRLFGFEAPYVKRKDCKANMIFCNGVKFVDYLLGLGLRVGNKVKQQVGIPDWVFTKMEYKTACLRGLMDTDGGVFMHRYKVGGKEYRYLKVCFTNRSMPILMFVRDVLVELGMTPKVVLGTGSEKVWLYNQDEVYEYLGIVGTHNSRLLKNLGGVR